MGIIAGGTVGSTILLFIFLLVLVLIFYRQRKGSESYPPCASRRHDKDHIRIHSRRVRVNTPSAHRVQPRSTSPRVSASRSARGHAGEARHQGGDDKQGDPQLGGGLRQRVHGVAHGQGHVLGERRRGSCAQAAPHSLSDRSLHLFKPNETVFFSPCNCSFNSLNSIFSFPVILCCLLPSSVSLWHLSLLLFVFLFRCLTV